MAPASKINLKDHLEDGQLDLSMSELQEVPVKDIANIKKATSLDLSNNRLLSLGKNFTILTNIIKLDLSNNLIKELPDNFGEMKQLKHLDLYSNQLKHLPLSFCELKSLRWLDVKNNPLVPALATIAGPCLEAKQCQQCAVKVVAFMGKMQAKVEEEQQRRAAQRQKDLEKNEAAASAAAPISKTQQKKNKKANKVVEKPKVEINETVIKQNDKQVVEPPKVKIVKNKNVKTQEKPRPKSAFYKNFCYYTTFSIVLFVYMAFISCLFYPSVFDDMKELSSIVGESTMKHMPSFVVDFIKDYIAPAGIYIQMLLKDLNLKMFNLHETMYQNELFKLMEDHIIEIWNNFKIILSDLFRTSVEVKE